MAERGFSTYMTPRSVGITPAGGLTPRVRNPLDSSLDFATIARADNMQIVRANMAGSATDVDAVATIVTRGRGMDDTVAIIPALPKIALYCGPPIARDIITALKTESSAAKDTNA
ncbi:uncharacterized protein RAG0_12441 [Rhynchosporium agropyri]|uniref:Uncharacterized protein n=1 Tax=Rhynchosporium agropyri TaxID=914238 RepID=A0A1E1LAV2_9HELO|nr:uncharacterized protein RAG0_12441 [Rhynchosporium agropyri]